MEEYSHPVPFPSTEWSSIYEADCGRTTIRREALNRVLSRYLPALRSHLMYKFRYSREYADDILQEFVAERVLEKDLLSHVDPEMGKFRTFVLKSLDNYVVSFERKREAKKREPDHAQSLEKLQYDLCSSKECDPAEEFNKRWAQQVLVQAVRSIRDHCERIERRDIWEVFKARVLDPIWGDQKSISYGQLVEDFSLESPAQAYNILASGKRIFRRCLRKVVGQYAGDEEQVDDEIKDLKAILVRCDEPPRCEDIDMEEGGMHD